MHSTVPYRKKRQPHEDTGDSQDQYPELDDILGKPASNFSQLVDQLETLLKHPRPPRNYADALAKEESRRMDYQDLSVDRTLYGRNSDGKQLASSAKRKTVLRQRPRMQRHTPPGADRQGNALVEDGNEQKADSDIKDSSSSPLPEEVAVNLGIGNEQQKRRRIWMTKIAGYQEFRKNLVSMDTLLKGLDEQRNQQDDQDEDGVDRLKHDLDLTKEDKEFEELLRKSMRLYDKDLSNPFATAVKDSYQTVSTQSGTKARGTNDYRNGPFGTRSYHTGARIVTKPLKLRGIESRNTNDNPYESKGSSKQTKAEQEARIKKESKRKKAINKKMLGDIGKSKPFMLGSRHSMIRRAELPSYDAVRKHFAESKEDEDEPYVAIDASVDAGDLVELRFYYNDRAISRYATADALGAVVQKTSGRFHLNVILQNNVVVGSREKRIGFVAKGVLFDVDRLRRSGTKNADIQRILDYGKKLREYEATHGKPLVTSSSEVLEFQQLHKQLYEEQSALRRLPTLNDSDAIGGSISSTELNAEDSMASQLMPEMGENVGAKQRDSMEEDEGEESISEVLLRVVPVVLRTFRQEAHQLMRSKCRELAEYSKMAKAQKHSHVTVDGLAKMVFKRGQDEPLRDEERYATYLHLVSEPLKYTPDAYGLFVTSRFEMRHTKSITDFHAIQDMIRSNTPNFRSFVEKARKLIAYSHSKWPTAPHRVALDPDMKALKESTHCKLTGWDAHADIFSRRPIKPEDTPTYQDVSMTTFEVDEAMFIYPLINYVFHSGEGYQNSENPYGALATPIIKKMGYYPACDKACVTRFLVDLGVWPHWFNPDLNTRDIPYGMMGRKQSKYYSLHNAAQFCSVGYLRAFQGYVDSGEEKRGLVNPRQLNTRKFDDYREVMGDKKILPEVRESLITKSSTGVGIIDPSRFYAQDLCEGMRHDFGNMPVYTIDDSETRDVDDGVSVETIGKHTWVHIHVADPTAIIHPGHIVSQAAQQQMVSIYYVEHNQHMLSKPLVEDKLSLIKHGKDKPTMAMTFSARLGDDGDIAEYLVRPSIVRNIKPTPYEQLDHHLSYTDSQKDLPNMAAIQEYHRMTTIVHPFASSDLDLPIYGECWENSKSLSKMDIKNLRRIQEIAALHAGYRTRHGSFTRNSCESSISLDDTQNIQAPLNKVYEPKYLLEEESTDPNVFPKIRVNSNQMLLSPAHKMVSELMMLGCRVGARYASEHGSGDPETIKANSMGILSEKSSYGVPFLFRSQEPPNLESLDGCFAEAANPFEGILTSEQTSSAQQIWDTVINSSKQNNGIISAKYFDELRHMLSPSILSTTAGPHTIIGIKDRFGYARITSPIRRMEDLINHWQIKAQMLAEHTNARDKQPWYWNRDQLERLAPTIFRRQMTAEGCMKSNEQFWMLTMMRRMENQARRGQLPLPPNGFYNTDSPLYMDLPWPYYNPQKPGPLVWTAIVDNRDNSRMFISLIIANTRVRGQLLTRPIHPLHLPFAGTKVRVQIQLIDPVDDVLMLKLAPEEYQPPETPKFWRQPTPINIMYSSFPIGRLPPENM